jgi:hypothetical protein
MIEHWIEKPEVWGPLLAFIGVVVGVAISTLTARWAHTANVREKRRDERLKLIYDTHEALYASFDALQDWERLYREEDDRKLDAEFRFRHQLNRFLLLHQRLVDGYDDKTVEAYSRTLAEAHNARIKRNPEKSFDEFFAEAGEYHRAISIKLVSMHSRDSR